MLTLILVAAVVAALILFSEIWWRKRPGEHNEFHRKFVHITVGSFAASWPFYLEWEYVLLLSAAFLVVVAVSKYLNIFQAIHAVQRPTWGEISFALAVGLLVFIARDPWIYAAAIMHMGLADGLAAIVGMAYGKGNDYKVFGHSKSLAGSLTFLLVSIGILSVYSMYGAPLSIAVIAGLAMATTLIENAGVKGIDNLLVPVLIGVVLVQLS